MVPWEMYDFSYTLGGKKQINIFPQLGEKTASAAKAIGPFTSITVIFTGFPSINVHRIMKWHAAARYAVTDSETLCS